MTKEEYEEMRNTIDSVGEYFNSIEELTKVRDLVAEVDASNEMAILVCVEDVDKALEFVGRDQWDSLYIKCPSEEEYANGQNTERNQ